jgi:sodium-coupled neutral amino acid transporter 11
LFFSFILFLTFLVVALVTCDLGVMLEITGGLSATALAFIFPAACYLRLIDSKAPWYSRTRLPAFACVTFGVIVMVISLFLALRKAWTPEGDAKICI